MDLKGAGCEIVDCVELDQDRSQAFVNTVMKLCFL
jgi:hypothetical protein